jgi:transposase-like protein
MMDSQKRMNIISFICAQWQAATSCAHSSVDKNAAYPEAFNSSQEEKVLPHDCTLRRVKYLKGIIEQNHRFIKKKVRGLSTQS